KVTVPHTDEAVKTVQEPILAADGCKSGPASEAIKTSTEEARTEAKKDTKKTVAEVDAVAAQAEATATARCNALDPKPYYDLLGKAGLVTLPLGSFSNWWVQIKESRKWPGMLISVLLLSLGAPFWYKVLAQLLQLRSAIAGKDDAQRDQRQGVTPADDGASPGVSSVANRGTAVANLPKGE